MVVTHNLGPVYSIPVAAVSRLKSVVISHTTAAPFAVVSAAKNVFFDSFYNADMFRMVLPGITVQVLAALVGTIATLLATSNHFKDMTENPNPYAYEQSATYDFIVVGSGTAGGVIANRLSENGIYKVLLLEAGGDPIVTNQIPYLMGHNINEPSMNWGFKTVPQKFSSFALQNNSINYSRGRSVGGSSNLNGMLYMRGSPKDFDNWARLTGDQQWSYRNLLPYFKRSEKYEGGFKNEYEYHGQDGPMYITSPTYKPLYKEWAEAGKEFGYPTADPNSWQTASFSSVEMNIHEGIRWQTYEGFIKPSLSRPNFKLIRYAHVSKIVLNDKNVATGVSYIRNGQTFEVQASKEIIISAGSIGTPQLLMLSGIGEASELKALGIKPKVNLPAVGRGLMDHPLVMVGPFLHNESVSYIQDRDLTYSVALEYIAHKRGPLAVPFVLSGNALITTKGDPSWPDVIGHHVAQGITTETADGQQYWLGAKDGIFQKYLQGLDKQDASYVMMYLGLPKSVGRVKIVSSNPLHAPEIDPNFFSDPYGEDIKAMVKGYKFFVDLLEKSQAFKKYNTTHLRRPFPGCESAGDDELKDFECRIKQLASTTYHPTSTCRMGKPDDPSAVVNSDLRVRGVKNLRIADGSVMPEITNTNVNAPIMMIAEKAADLILKYWSTPEYIYISKPAWSNLHQLRLIAKR